MLPLLLGALQAWLAPVSHAADDQPELGQEGKDVVWVPTPDALAPTMLDLAQVGANDYVIDLGAGDGRLVILAAQRGARALGIEYDAKLVRYAQAAAAKAGVAARAQFIRADLFATDFSRATVVTLFLGDELNRKLLPKLLALKPGTRIVSNTHPIGDWPADATAHSSDDEKSVYYRSAKLWIVPAKVAGVWQMPQGQLRITQHFQQIEGALQSKGRSMPMSQTRLRGDQLSFVAGDTRYAGTVKNDVIDGTMVRGRSTTPWRARRELRDIHK